MAVLLTAHTTSQVAYLPSAPPASSLSLLPTSPSFRFLAAPSKATVTEFLPRREAQIPRRSPHPRQRGLFAELFSRPPSLRRSPNATVRCTRKRPRCLFDELLSQPCRYAGDHAPSLPLCWTVL